MRIGQELADKIMGAVEFPSPPKTFWQEFEEWARDKMGSELELLEGVHDYVCQTGELPWHKGKPPLTYKGVEIETLIPYEAYCALEEIARGERHVSMRVVNRLREIAYEEIQNE